MASKKTQSNRYDVIIVGGGPAGLFAAYYLSEHSDLRVLLLEKGKGTSKRVCPIKEDQLCVKCKPCNILCGIGGAGLFSDGKLNYIHKLGKTDLTVSAWTALFIPRIWKQLKAYAKTPNATALTF